MKSLARQIVTQRRILPSSEELNRFGTNGMLALLHDAVGHLVTPIDRLPQVIPTIEQIANTLAEQQVLLKEMLTIQRDAALVRSAANKLEGVPSLPHSVLKRDDLHFVSVSKSYALLFDFSAAQFHTLSFNELVHSRNLPRFYKMLRLLLKGKVGTCELVEWRATGSGHFVLTKDTLWGIGSDQVRGPEYIATVSQRIADQGEAAMVVERASSRYRGRSGD